MTFAALPKLNSLSADVADLGRALGTYMLRHSGPRINLGRDCRLSSPRLHDALLEGLQSTGCEVTDIGVVPTPLLYFSAVHLEADGAIMITGSHNPSEFNGFKTVCGAGLAARRGYSGRPPPDRRPRFRHRPWHAAFDGRDPGLSG